MIIQSYTVEGKGSPEVVFPGAPAGPLAYGFSTRLHGNMSFIYGQTTHALQNRRNFLEGLAIDPGSLVCAEQVHGSRVYYATERDRGRGATSQETAVVGSDAFITDRTGLPLALFSADCLIVFLYDPLTPAIGIVHAGWKGTRDRILVKTVEAMKAQFSTRPERLTAAFSPSIRGCCYRVGKEFLSYFPGLVIERNGGLHFDLARANFNQLLECGVHALNIGDMRRCSVCDNAEYFSYRCEAQDSGRALAVLMLR